METGEISQKFLEIGEPFAAGLWEKPERSRFYRYALAFRRYWETIQLSPYDGGELFPCGKKKPQELLIFPDFSFTIEVQWRKIEKMFPELKEVIAEEYDLTGHVDHTRHHVGGNGYTHSVPAYERVLREGLDGYRKRILEKEPGDFRDGLLEVLEGIRAYRDRCLEHLREKQAPQHLIRALEKVPFAPPETLYEAVVAWNFIYYVDGCDNPGRLDSDLMPYYHGENAVPWIREFFLHADENDGWSAAIGYEETPLTVQCLKACKGIRRPSVELWIDDNTSDEVWQAAMEALEAGGGSPSLYNKKGFERAFAEYFPEISGEELSRLNGGGCTEMMLAGMSNVGSLDAGMNLPLIFSEYMEEYLETAESFEKFYEGLLSAIRAETLMTLEEISSYQKRRAMYRPQPIRTLLTDDCIEKGKDFNAGGARYYWSVVNLAGIVNVVDSLLVIRELVYKQQCYTGSEFLKKLAAQETEFLRRANDCPHYGVDEDEADGLAADFAERVFAVFDERTPWLGGRFLPSSIQFTTYLYEGKCVPATPDGRKDGGPLADSLGPIFGRDRKGPTAMLNSVTKLPLKNAPGTPVLNIRLQKQMMKKGLRPLAEGYFERGGLQMQVSCISKEDMLDAMEHPERHENLIVRVGGYSEYFNRLDSELQQTILERTEF